VKGVDVDVDRRSGMSQGTATVTFSSEQDAEHALFYLDGGQIDNNVIKVSFVLVPASRRKTGTFLLLLFLSSSLLFPDVYMAL
jgi:RNA recognition motif-containing protein